MFEKVYFGNTLASYLKAGIIAAATIALLVLITTLIRKLLLRKSGEEEHSPFVLAEGIVRRMLPLFIVSAFYVVVRTLTLADLGKRIALNAYIVLGIFFAVRILTHVIEFFMRRQVNETVRKGISWEQVKGVLPAIKFAIWLIALFFVLDNFGVKVSALAAGLGVGGIAVALGAQSFLGDLFSYYSIIMDRPFRIGDFIIFDAFMGTVEYIGIKTTRVRSLSGEQLVVSNTNLTSSSIRNFKRMERRRIVFSLGVTYDTAKASLERIPTIIKDAIDAQENLTFDRAHFKGFGDFALLFETVYYVESSDYLVYMEAQQGVNFTIVDAFRKDKIEFAFPTQTIHIAEESALPPPSRTKRKTTR